MLATANWHTRILASACGLALFAMPLLANDRSEDADAIHDSVTAMADAAAARDAAGFAAVFTEQEEASLWGQALRYNGTLAIEAWMNGLLGLVPEAATYVASAPRIILRPDGDADAAWVTSDWSWAVWDGRATGRMRRESGEWRFHRVDFFGMKVVEPEADMDPTWATQMIGAASATVDAVGAATTACDVPGIAALALPTFRFVEADGSDAPDPIAAITAHCATGAFDGFNAASAAIYIDAQAEKALVVDTNAPGDSLRLLLSLEDGGWFIEAAALGDHGLATSLDVSAQGRVLTSWARIRRGL